MARRIAPGRRLVPGGRRWGGALTRLAVAGGGEPDPYVLAPLAFGLACERAVVGWFDELPAAIRGHAARSDNPVTPAGP